MILSEKTFHCDATVSPCLSVSHYAGLGWLDAAVAGFVAAVPGIVTNPLAAPMLHLFNQLPFNISNWNRMFAPSAKYSLLYPINIYNSQKLLLLRAVPGVRTNMRVGFSDHNNNQLHLNLCSFVMRVVKLSSSLNIGDLVQIQGGRGRGAAVSWFCIIRNSANWSRHAPPIELQQARSNTLYSPRAKGAQTSNKTNKYNLNQWSRWLEDGRFQIQTVHCTKTNCPFDENFSHSSVISCLMLYLIATRFCIVIYLTQQIFEFDIWFMFDESIAIKSCHKPVKCIWISSEQTEWRYSHRIVDKVSRPSITKTVLISWLKNLYCCEQIWLKLYIHTVQKLKSKLFWLVFTFSLVHPKFEWVKVSIVALQKKYCNIKSILL